jgi:hypothetical protein
MTTEGQHQDAAQAHRAATLARNSAVAALSGAGAALQSTNDLGSLVVVLLELVRELANERGQQLELTETLLTTIRTLLEEQAELQRDVAGLRRRVDALGAPATQTRALGPDEPSDGSVDGHRALREQTHQARRHALELTERGYALSDRATELIAEARRVTANAPRAGQTERRRR